jgi:hypothetical protein
MLSISQMAEALSRTAHGYAVVTLDVVIKAQPLPVGPSAQKDKLIALT